MAVSFPAGRQLRKGGDLVSQVRAGPGARQVGMVLLDLGQPELAPPRADTGDLAVRASPRVSGCAGGHLVTRGHLRRGHVTVPARERGGPGAPGQRTRRDPPRGFASG